MSAPLVTSGTWQGVDVYRNLLRHTVSIRQAGKVVAYANTVAVVGVTFRVQPAGVRRIRNQGQREVIAFARGTATVLPDGTPLPEGAVRVCFDPFKHDTFVTEDGRPITSADLLIVTSPHGQWAVNPR